MHRAFYINDMSSLHLNVLLIELEESIKSLRRFAASFKKKFLSYTMTTTNVSEKVKNSYTIVVIQMYNSTGSWAQRKDRYVLNAG